MATGTVKINTNWKGADGVNAGQLFVGDILRGSVTTTVFNFYEIIRKSNGNVIKVNGTCGLTALNVVNDGPPPPPPPPDEPPPPSVKTIVKVVAYWDDNTREEFYPQ